MNTSIVKFCFILLVFIPLSGIAQVEKEKKIERTFNIPGSGSMSIINRYGDVHIETWDKNIVDLKVTIGVTKRSESIAREFLDRINVDIDQTGNNLRFETTFDGSIRNSGKDKMKINYNVHVPANLSMDLVNSYGNLYLSKAEGEVALKVSYGNLKIGDLQGNNELKLSYGNGEIDSFSKGEIIVNYSNLSVEQVGDVDIKNNYSNLEITDVDDVDANNKYGNIVLSSAHNLNGFSKYGKVSIGKLYDSVIFEILHGGGLTIDWISKDFQTINLESSYATVKLGFEHGAGGDLDAEMRYCDLKNYDLGFDYSFIDESGNTKSYKGKLGDKNGQGKIKIRSSYGSVKIRYAD